MTKLWKPFPIWAGETVAVLASGTTMSQDVADDLSRHRTIAVNDASRLAPWADALVALDGNWPPEYRDFAGMRVTGVADATLDAFYVGHQWQAVRLAPNHVIEIRNSGLYAVRLAAELGAARIILAGFDPETRRQWYDDEADTGEYVGLRAALDALTAELIAKGVLVETYDEGRIDV